MNQSSDKLFELINSLSRREKGYFKLYAMRHKGTTSFTRLFTVMAKQKQYDEKQIRKICRNESFAGHLTETRYKLYNLILKALHAYHSHSSADARLKEFLHYVEILYAKGLYDDCLRILQKTKKTAYRHDKHLTVVEIMEWEKKIAYRTVNLRSLESDVNETFREKLLLFERQKNLAEYSRYHSLINIMSRTGKLQSRKKKDVEEYRALMKTPLMANANRAVSLQGKIYFYRIYSNYYLANENYSKMLDNNRKWMELMEANPAQISEEPNDYIEAVNNIIYASSYLKKYNKVTIHIFKLRNIHNMLPPSRVTETLHARIFSRSYNLELSHYIDTGQFEKGGTLINKVAEGLNRFGNKITKVDKLTFYYKIVTLYYYTGDYSKTLLWLNRILNEPDETILPDIHSSSRLINLLLHFDLRHFDLLEHIVRSTYRFHYKRGILYKFERSVMEFIRKVFSGIVTQEQQLRAFLNLKSELTELKKDPYEKSVLEAFDFISWLESKISQRPFADIVKEKALHPSARHSS